MHTVRELEFALQLAEQLGYEVRHELLDGAAGGSCEFAGRRWLFVDLALPPHEQLQQVRDSLVADPRFTTLGLDAATRQQWKLPHAA